MEKTVSRRYRVIRWLVRLFFPRFRTEGEEKLPEGPFVIVGNHSQAYGPIAGELYVPGKPYTWCTGEMMSRKEAPDYAFRDFWSGKPKSVRWLFYLFSRMIGPLSELVFNNARTVGVYHDMRIMQTFRESVTLLEEGENLLVFPECYEPHNQIVYSFQDHFVDVARMYYKKTGKALAFVPMYIAPRLKTIYMLEPVCFRPDAPIREERERICAFLMDAVTEKAVSLPRHRVVPYPNLPKKEYPYNISSEGGADEKKQG